MPDDPLAHFLAELERDPDAGEHFIRAVELLVDGRLSPGQREAVRDVCGPLNQRSSALRDLTLAGLRAEEPVRYVRFALGRMVLRGPDPEDTRNDWAGLELLATYARERGADVSQVLDAARQTSPFLADLLTPDRLRLFEEAPPPLPARRRRLFGRG